jgi:phosphoesterase RecJ-like protein
MNGKRNSMFPWQDKNNILITTHAYVDPDALGSLVALYSFLQSQGKAVTACVQKEIPAGLRFLTRGVSLTECTDIDLSTFDLAVVLDCGSLAMTNLESLEGSGLPIVNVDHHPTNAGYGAVAIVEPELSSTAEILYNFFIKEAVQITPFQATALLAGMAGDTGMFRHVNTTASVLAAASDLMIMGADLNLISQSLFRRTSQQTCALGLALNNAYYDKENQALVTAVTESELKESYLDEESLAPVVGFLNTCFEAQYVAFFKQKGGEVSGSLRSESYKNYDVSKLAQSFGGGGHRLAAGFKVKGSLVQENGAFVIKV